MKALICVDIQNDFISGSLAVKDGDQVVPVANRLITNGNFGVIILTQDWHPPIHKSFASNNSGTKVGDIGELSGKPQVMWENHCVWDTFGADFHKDLLTGQVDLILRKGMNENVDSYSGFHDNNGDSIGLSGYLKDDNVVDVYVSGLALDFCVKYTALDSVKLGFNTYLIIDGCRAVNINPDDGINAIVEMKAAGVKIIHSDKLIKRDLINRMRK